MDVRQRPVKHQSHQRLLKSQTSGELLKPHHQPKASDALPLPLYLTNGLFFTLFFSVMYFFLHRWRDKTTSDASLSAEYGEEKTQQSGAMIVEAVESSSGSIKKSKNGGLVSVSDPVQASRKGGASSLGGSPVVPSPSPEVRKNPSSPLSTAADGSKEPTASASPPPSTAMAASASRFLKFASRSSSLPSRCKQQPNPSNSLLSCTTIATILTFLATNSASAIAVSSHREEEGGGRRKMEIKGWEAEDGDQRVFVCLAIKPQGPQGK